MTVKFSIDGNSDFEKRMGKLFEDLLIVGPERLRRLPTCQGGAARPFRKRSSGCPLCLCSFCLWSAAHLAKLRFARCAGQSASGACSHAREGQPDVSASGCRAAPLFVLLLFMVSRAPREAPLRKVCGPERLRRLATYQGGAARRFRKRLSDCPSLVCADHKQKELPEGSSSMRVRKDSNPRHPGP